MSEHKPFNAATSKLANFQAFTAPLTERPRQERRIKLGLRRKSA